MKINIQYCLLTIVLSLSPLAWAQEALLDLESASKVKIGVSATNTANEKYVQYRQNEPFALGSTYKMLVAGLTLKKSVTDPKLMSEKINFQQEDIVSWSPITKQHIKDGMTVFDLTAATLMYSDTTASNLLLKKLGGNDALMQFVQSFGDNSFRAKENLSTPAAMERLVLILGLDDGLPKTQREQLVTWMKNNTTGNNRIRAGVPAGWVVADKTGTGPYGVANDIGIIWPPQCAPITLAIYSSQNNEDAKPRNDVIAKATQIVLTEFAKDDPCIKAALSL